MSILYHGTVKGSSDITKTEHHADLSPEDFSGIRRIDVVFRTIAVICGLITVSVALIILAGWLFNSGFVYNTDSVFSKMKPNASLCFILTGISFLLSIIRAESGFYRNLARGILLIVAALCIVSLLGYFLKSDIIHERNYPGAAGKILAIILDPPLPFNTLLCFLLLCFAILINNLKFRVSLFLSEILVIAVIIICVIHLLGYLYGAEELVTSAFYSKMSLVSSGTFVIISTGILCIRPSDGFLSILTVEGLGSFIASRLYPVTLLIPVLYIWIRLMTKSGQFRSSPMDMVIVSVLYIAILGYMIWRVASAAAKIEKEFIRLNKELETRVIERTGQLLESNKELESFAYSVSHDLRAPLRHVIGFSDKLESVLGEDKDPEVIRLIGRIVSASSRMNHLIDELLRYSRLGRTELRIEKVSLDHIVKDIIKNASEITRNRNIEWEVHDLPDVEADSVRISLVMENLINNAIKFTGKKDKAIIEIGFSGEHIKEHLIFVKDNGAGFDMAYSDKLFNVFQRLHSTKDFEGTGIGLANVRRIIGRHGGKVWAEGKVNEGAVFYFTLPKQQGKSTGKI
jgi:signal transduction histidine kinase